MKLITTQLPFSPIEDPFKVEHGGFYRRWLSMIDDIDYLKKVVSSITSTTEDIWVLIWKNHGKIFEEEGDAFAQKGNKNEARQKYLQAKTFYSIGRFPDLITESKKEIHEDCLRAFDKASQWLNPPLKIVKINHKGKSIRCHLRQPLKKGKHPAVLIMCGADVFKEDRAWACDLAIENDMTGLVMDAPGTAENPFPWEPESVSAWKAAIDYLANLRDVDENRIGAFGISRGGYSVMQLAGCYNNRVKAVVANAGHPFGYKMTKDELENYLVARNKRAEYIYGKKGGPLSFPKWTAEDEDKIFKKWALSELGILDKINQPILLINGKHDYISPVGNIYFMLEHGSTTGKEARVYSDAGHCAFKYFDHWAPESFRWLKEKLSE